MNFIKTLAAAAVLAAISAPALASIKSVADGTSELVLVVGDSNGSFILDTGVSLNSLLASSSANGTLFSRTVAGAAWTSYTNSDTNIFDGNTRWALFVYDGNGSFDPTNLRTVSTLGASTTLASFNFDADSLNGAYAQTGSVITQANGTGTHTGLPAVNGSSFNAKGTAGYAGASFFSYGGTNVAIGNGVGIASRLALVAGSDPDDSSLPVAASYVGNLKASFDGTTLVVAAPVPEPESYALMVAGLAAIGFIARRRRSA